MYGTTDAYRKAASLPSRYISWRGTVTDANGKEYSITTSNMSEKGMRGTNQICANSNIEIGTAYIGECSLSAYIEADRYTMFGGTIKMEFGMELQDGTYEWIPCKTYTTDEATVSEGLMTLTGYDKMSRLAVPLDTSITELAPYDIISRLCALHDIILATSRKEIEEMPNGKVLMSLWSSDGTTGGYTQQDIVGYVCQALGAYCFIGNDDRLYVKQYGSNADMVIEDSNRFSLTLSDYETRFSSITYTMMSDSKSYTLGDYSYLDMTLEANPMLQSGDAGTMKAYYQSILDTVAKMAYTPFEADMPIDASLEVGDIIEFRGGEAVEGRIAPITYMEYASDGSMTIRCEGANPRLKDRTKTDSQAQSMLSSIESKNIYYYNFDSDGEVDISDGGSQTVFDIRFAQVSTNQITLQGEITCDCETTEEETDDSWIENDLEVTLTYTMNDAVLTDHVPVERNVGGRHVFPFYFPFVASGGTTNRMIGTMSAKGGSIRIKKHGIYATIWGQGLYAKFANTLPMIEDIIGGLEFEAMEEFTLEGISDNIAMKNENESVHGIEDAVRSMTFNAVEGFTLEEISDTVKEEEKDA